MSEALGLDGEKGREWSIRGSCATKGEGLEEGLDWCVFMFSVIPNQLTNPLVLYIQACEYHPKEITYTWAFAFLSSRSSQSHSSDNAHIVSCPLLHISPAYLSYPCIIGAPNTPAQPFFLLRLYILLRLSCNSFLMLSWTSNAIYMAYKLPISISILLMIRIQHTCQREPQ